MGGTQPNQFRVAHKSLRRPRGMHWARKKARDFLATTASLTSLDQNRLLDLLHRYVEDVKEKALVSQRLPDMVYDPAAYAHRFSPKYLKRRLREFNRAWDMLSANERVGTFFTFTLSLERAQQQGLLKANKSASARWDKVRRLLDKFAKRRGKEPKYIRVAEFAESGLLHLHVVVFGLLIPPERIEKWAVKHGYGSVFHVAHVNLLSDGLRLRNYLSKTMRRALKDGLKDPRLALYWAMGIRFYTASRLPKAPKSPRLPGN